MQYIQPLANFSFNATPVVPAVGKTANALLKQPGQQIFEILLAPAQTLAKHSAVAPITVLCLAGQGRLWAGAELDESVQLTAGILLALPANVPHEIRAETALHLLVSKFG